LIGKIGLFPATRFGPWFAVQWFVIAPSTLPALQWSASSIENHGLPFAAHDAGSAKELANVSADQTPSSFQNIFAATLTPENSAPAPRNATLAHPAPERSAPQAAKTQSAEGAQRPAASSADASARAARSAAKPLSPSAKSRGASQSTANPKDADQGAATPSGVNTLDGKQRVAGPSQAQGQALPQAANAPLPVTVAATVSSQPERPPATVPLLAIAMVGLPPGSTVPPLASDGGPLGSADIAFALHITPDGGVNQSGPPTGQPQTTVSPNANPAGVVPGQSAAAPFPLNAKQTVSSAAAPNTTAASAGSAAAVNAGTPPRPRSAAAASAGGPNPTGTSIVNPGINPVLCTNPTGNPIPWAAPTFDNAASSGSSYVDSAAAAPVSAIAADPSDAAAAPMRSVRVQLAGEGDQRVDMRLVEYAGGLSVSVRASDNSLTRGLQDHLPELSARLAAEHYQAQAWLPSVSQAPTGKSLSGSSEQSADQSPGRGGGQAFSQGGSSSSGGDRQQQQGRNPQRSEAWWKPPGAAELHSSAASPLGIPTANSNQEK